MARRGATETVPRSTAANGGERVVVTPPQENSPISVIPAHAH